MHTAFDIVDEEHTVGTLASYREVVRDEHHGSLAIGSKLIEPVIALLRGQLDGGRRVRDEVLSRGFTRAPLEMFEAFKGGPPEVKPLLEARALDPAASA
jgi:hypothetical protein